MFSETKIVTVNSIDNANGNVNDNSNGNVNDNGNGYG